MNVQELIEVLRKMPPEAPVKYADPDFSGPLSDDFTPRDVEFDPVSQLVLISIPSVAPYNDND